MGMGGALIRLYYIDWKMMVLLMLRTHWKKDWIVANQPGK